MRRWPRTAPTAAGPQPSHSSERCGPPRPCRTSVSTTRSTHLPQCSGWSPRRRPCTSLQLHRGEWKLHLPLHSRQRLFDQPLPGSYEPILRAVLGVPYPSSHQPTVVHTMLPNLAVQRLPVLLGDLGHRTAELRRHDPNRKLDHPEPLVSTLRAVPQQLPLVPRRIRPQHHLLHPRRQTAQRFNQHSQLLMARRYVAVPRMHDQLGPTIAVRSGSVDCLLDATVLVSMKFAFSKSSSHCFLCNPPP